MVKFIYECYGLDRISSDVTKPVQSYYGALCKRFNVTKNQVLRPSSIDMLLSAKSSCLMSDHVIKSQGNMKLFNGPLGKVFCGSDKDL